MNYNISGTYVSISFHIIPKQLYLCGCNPTDRRTLRTELIDFTNQNEYTIDNMQIVLDLRREVFAALKEYNLSDQEQQVKDR